jgi:hypothetical protein
MNKWQPGIRLVKLAYPTIEITSIQQKIQESKVAGRNLLRRCITFADSLFTPFGKEDKLGLWPKFLVAEWRC